MTEPPPGRKRGEPQQPSPVHSDGTAGENLLGENGAQETDVEVRKRSRFAGACPRCRAKPGKPCVTDAGKVYDQGYSVHVSRYVPSFEARARKRRSDTHSDVVPPEEREKYQPPKLVEHTLEEDLEAFEKFVWQRTGPRTPRETVAMLRRIHTRLHVLGRRP